MLYLYIIHIIYFVTLIILFKSINLFFILHNLKNFVPNLFKYDLENMETFQALYDQKR